LGEGLGERAIYKIHLPQPLLIGVEENNRSLLRNYIKPNQIKSNPTIGVVE